METLDEMRKSIDNIDNAIVAMLAERFKITDRVGVFKARNQLPAKDEAREAAQFKRIAELARHYGLDADFAQAHLATVIAQVVKKHEMIAAGLRESQ
jgi:chorismate mutase